MKRSLLAEGRGIPPGRVLAPANRHDSPLPAPTPGKPGGIGPLPDDITVASTPAATRRKPATSWTAAA